MCSRPEIVSRHFSEILHAEEATTDGAFCCTICAGLGGSQQDNAVKLKMNGVTIFLRQQPQSWTTESVRR